MGKPFFSIVVPVYNVEKYLGECVNSILKQDYCDYEIILVDDGSTDSSGAICDSLKERFSVVNVIHKENGGLSDARNCGVRASSGEYLLFVDSDDYISDGSLKEIHESIVASDNPDIICIDGVNSYDDICLNVPINEGVSLEVNALRGDGLYYYLGHLGKFPAAAWSKAIRKVFFLDNELFFEKRKLSEDLEWAVRLFTSAIKISYCPVVYYHYRTGRPGSITATKTEKNYLHIFDTVRKSCLLAKQEKSAAKKYMIHSFVEYMYRTLIMGYLDIKDKAAYKEKLNTYDYVFGTRTDRNSKIVRYAYKCLGLRLSCILLRWYVKNRNSLFGSR